MKLNRMGVVEFAIWLLAIFAASTSLPVRAQQLSPALAAAIGQWQVIDDEGKPGGQVKTYLNEGRLFGKVTQSRPERPPNEPCTKCPGELKDKPILGMIIIRDFRPDGDRWVGGTVLDPENGKIYRGKIWAVGPDRLRMRGYVGIPLLGRSQTWTRLP